MKKYKVGIIGATGLVGRKILQVLFERSFPIESLRLGASVKSINKKIFINDYEFIVSEINQAFFHDLDFLFFTTNEEVTQYWLSSVNEKTWIIDNSKLLRETEPLIIPSVNDLDILSNKHHILANPNCTTIACILAINPLLSEYTLKRINFTTYQAVSGSGKFGLEALNSFNNCYPIDIRKTCWPKIGESSIDGYTEEEWKMIKETKKILHINIPISATCIRVPISVGHAAVVQLETKEKIDISKVKALFQSSGNIIICDDLEQNILPNAVEAIETDYVYVGRIRKDLTSCNTLLFYLVADNLRVGAASNAVKIAEKIIELQL